VAGELKGFQLYVDLAKPLVLGPSVLSHNLSGLVAGSDHYVQVVAVTADDQSSPVAKTFSIAFAPKPQAALATAKPVTPSPPVATQPQVTIPAAIPATPVAVLPQAVVPTAAPAHDVSGLLEGLFLGPGNPLACTQPLTYKPGATITLTDDATGRVLATSTIGDCLGGPDNDQEFGFGFGAPPLTANMHLRIGNATWPLTQDSLVNDLNYDFIISDPGTAPSAMPTSNGPSGDGCFNMGDISCP
jgi:hypothetical protein